MAVADVIRLNASSSPGRIEKRNYAATRCRCQRAKSCGVKWGFSYGALWTSAHEST